MGRFLRHGVDGGQDAPCEGAIFRGKYIPGHARRQSAVRCAKTAEPIEMPFWLWARVGSRNHALDGVQISHATEQF